MIIIPEKEDLKSAKALFEISEYRGSNNRAYFAIYHIISAIHALSEVVCNRHNDTIANFI